MRSRVRPGSAAIAGLSGKKNVECFILFPEGRVSPIQQLQVRAACGARLCAMLLCSSAQRVLKPQCKAATRMQSQVQNCDPSSPVVQTICGTSGTYRWEKQDCTVRTMIPVLEE